MERQEDGVHRVQVEEAREGDLYAFVFPDGRKRPDPRSYRQPKGVHGPSAVVDLGRLADLSRSPAEQPRRPIEDWILYELHVGTFTPRGTFDGLIDELGYLKDELGISAIELMPVCPFPGTRNWGYDGVAPYAVQESYGGPDGLARLVRAAHERGIAVVLDVVYNHLGPEGNYLREFGPYFTDRYETPWGEAIDYDGADAAQVRAWAVENAAHWIRTFGIDGLRLDAVHAIHDAGPKHVLAEIGEAVQGAGGKVIAESDLNDPVTVVPRPAGWGLDAQWSDDLHHALHAILSGERTGYYRDYGRTTDVALALRRGFAYDGSRYSSFRQKWLGRSSAPMDAEDHVVCIQNHDQIGNRAQGDRFADTAGLEAAKVAASVVLLSPGIPLLFMGEEYAAPQPFPFFTSHGDPKLAHAVRKGRRYEFSAFRWQGAIPDPQSPATFESAILHLGQRSAPGHREMLALYRALIGLRTQHPALQGRERKHRLLATARDDAGVLALERWDDGDAHRLALLVSFAREAKELIPPLSPGTWRLLLDSKDAAFGGEGGAGGEALDVAAMAPARIPPLSARIYERR